MYQDATFYDRPGRNHTLANDGVPMLTCDGNLTKYEEQWSDRGQRYYKAYRDTRFYKKKSIRIFYMDHHRIIL